MTTITEASPKVAVQPFGIEIDHPRNADVLLACIMECRLRSALNAPKPMLDWRTRRNAVPIDVAMEVAKYPEVPGMQIHVNPAKCTYTVIDPLHGDEKLCAELVLAIRENDPTAGLLQKIDGVEPTSGTIDKHKMKTLCRELIDLLDMGFAKMVKGPKPTMKDVDELPGYYELNPGSRFENSMPRFEKDYQQWLDRLNNMGGS